MIVAVVLAGGTGTRVGGAVPKQFIEVMGKPVLAYTLERFQNNANIDAIENNENATDKDEDLLTTLEVAYEYYLRGFEFLPIDLYKSEAIRFSIEDGRLRPPFVAISGLGESAAWDLVEGRKGKQFLSIEEVAAACPKVSKTHMQMLKDAGAFGGLPDTSQVSFF